MAHKKFFCIDAHTCGNPVRLVAGGGPLLEGNSMMEKRLHFLREYDWIRKGLMFEPRGHDMRVEVFYIRLMIRKMILGCCSLKPVAACPCVDMEPLVPLPLLLKKDW